MGNENSMADRCDEELFDKVKNVVITKARRGYWVNINYQPAFLLPNTTFFEWRMNKAELEHIYFGTSGGPQLKAMSLDINFNASHTVTLWHNGIGCQILVSKHS